MIPFTSACRRDLGRADDPCVTSQPYERTHRNRGAYVRVQHAYMYIFASTRIRAEGVNTYTRVHRRTYRQAYCNTHAHKRDTHQRIAIDRTCKNSSIATSLRYPDIHLVLLLPLLPLHSYFLSPPNPPSTSPRFPVPTPYIPLTLYLFFLNLFIRILSPFFSSSSSSSSSPSSSSFWSCVYC